MPAALNATVGDPAANSYADTDFVTTYMEERETDAAWASATEDQRTRALIAGARALDRLTWPGYRASGTQALQWPRSCVRDPDAPVAGLYIGIDTIPARVKRGQCEWAYAVLSGSFAGDETGLDAFKAVKVGSLEIEMREQPSRADEMPDRVRREIAPILEGGGATVRLVRG